MKWVTIAFMAVLCAVSQANAVHLPGAEATATATTKRQATAVIDHSAALGNTRQGSSGVNEYTSEEKGVQSLFLRQALANKFPIHEYLKSLFVPSNKANSSEQSTEPSPEPATLFLFGSGLAGCIFIFRRRW